MNIKNLLKNAAENCRALAGRLEVQRSATHDPSDKADLQEWIEDCRNQIAALSAVASAYGPIIQSAIETGIEGHTHRIVVQRQNLDCLAAGITDKWEDVSMHEFTVDKSELVGPADC